MQPAAVAPAGVAATGIAADPAPAANLATLTPPLPSLNPRPLATRTAVAVVPPAMAPVMAKGDRLAAAPPTDPSTLDGDVQRTRFIIRLGKHSNYQVFALSNPNRVIVELNDVAMSLPPLPKDGPIGLVADFRGGTSGPAKSRVVIDVVSPVVVENATMTRTRRGAELGLDIIPIGKGLRAAGRAFC